MKKKEYRRISFSNWFFTLVFSIIPGVNLVWFLLTLIFAKTPSKRSFAAAALVLSVLLLVAICVAVFVYGDAVATWASELLAVEN